MLKKEKLIVSHKYDDGVKFFHHIILEENKDELEFRLQGESKEQVCPYEEMDKITMPMTLVPEYQAMILKGFYDPERVSSKEIFYENCKYCFDSFYDERADVISKIELCQDCRPTSDNLTVIELEWNVIKIPRAPVSARVMPESLAWLVKNLKAIYNDWQKDHPECEKMK
jgi:hypothetical protein